MNLDRLEKLIGKDNARYISSLNTCLIGVGGVGGYTLEGLVRLGVKKITIIDSDVIDSTNLNRQIISNSTNIGNLKVEEARKRALMINPSVQVATINVFLDKENVRDYINDNFDYVIDACDTLNTKIALIKYCYNSNIKIISSMGTAKKIDGTLLKISTLDKTKYCPLARKIRKELSILEQKYVKVVYSEEKPSSIKELGSVVYVPAIAGFLICNIIVKDTLKIGN